MCCGLHDLLKDKSGKVSKVGIVGATKGYGYTLLAQIPKVAQYWNCGSSALVIWKSVKKY